MDGNEGTEVGQTNLKKSSDYAQFWIEGNTVVGPQIGSQGIGLWNYPNGGLPAKSIAGLPPYGVTISLK
jgi:hypothetical protein